MDDVGLSPTDCCSDLSVYVFDGLQSPEADGPQPADGTVTELEGRVGDCVRRWVLVEPGLDVQTGDGLGVSPQITLHARKLDDMASPHYSVLRVKHVMPIAYAVPADELDNLDRWYAEEHADKLLRCDAWLRVRRYEILAITGARWNRLVIHDLAAADVLQRDEVRAAMATPWRQALARRPWFLAEPRAALRVRPRRARFDVSRAGDRRESTDD